jgi:hypothetical protein
MCGPLWPIGDDAGPGEVESLKPRNPPGSSLYYCGRGGGGGGGEEGCRFSYLLESHMTYLYGSHVLRSWPGIRLNRKSITIQNGYTVSDKKKAPWQKKCPVFQGFLAVVYSVAFTV